VLRLRRLMAEHQFGSAIWWLERFVTDEAAAAGRPLMETLGESDGAAG
jgi:hypothetical protein